MHDIEGYSMIIGKILGCHKRNRDDFAIRNSCAYVGLVIKIGHGRINEDKRCYNPSGVHENFSADVDLSIHIVAKLFIGVNQQSGCDIDCVISHKIHHNKIVCDMILLLQ